MKTRRLNLNLLKIKQLPPPIWVMTFLLVAFLLQACEKDVSSAAPYADTLQSYYIESTHLGDASVDSINSFAHKVLRLTEAWPEVKDEQQYRDIAENIHIYTLRFSFVIDDRWDGIIEINKE